MNEVKSLVNVLVIDDDLDYCESIVDTLECEGYLASYWATPDVTQVKAKAEGAQLLILDLQMPGMDGIEVMRQLATVNRYWPVILVSGHDQSVLNSAARFSRANPNIDIWAKLRKPFPIDALISAISNNIAKISAAKVSPSVQAPPGIKVTEEEFKSGLQNNEFILYLQPKVGLADGRLQGAECLSRWNHPVHGVLSPYSFIELAESDLYSREFTMNILEQALSLQASWFRQCQKHLRLSINVPSNILSETLPDDLYAMASRYQIPADTITIELTESRAVDSHETSSQVLTRLRLKGFHLSIDDFGTGYSSLQTLRELPFDELKVDTQFTLNALKEEHARSILGTSIELADKLGLALVVEGIENQDVLQLVKTLSNNRGAAQGFLFSKPLPQKTFFENYINLEK